MKKSLALVMAWLSVLGGNFPATAWVLVSNGGDTGWRTYTYTAGTQGFTGTVGFVVSNVLDNSAYSELLLDNLSQGGNGNGGFEKGIYEGYQLLGNSYGEVTSERVLTLSGNEYWPTQGDFMSHQCCLETGTDTSSFRNCRGQAGTTGSILETTISLAPGAQFSFNWAFVGGDQSPYNDFSLIYLKDAQGVIVFQDGLGQLGRPRFLPHLSLLLGSESAEKNPQGEIVVKGE